MKRVLNLLGLGFTTLIIATVGCALVFGFVVSAFLLLIAGILRTFGMEWIQMNIGAWEVPQAFSLPVALGVSILLCAVAFGIWKGLKKYVIWVRG
ncbi:hypothetical protein IMZ31_06130 [Pontibacillus sp. ALD_SL1]|uniref:hypothetical protein n=1 Tax=Pontibacillus sp. ALD_SL1 TaxID=2777185 RepID=UPI001A9749BF|nr:hypothetical protein [Pontibacillus sp. ALD_SL1]QST01138.1 hypothetical protein IMZ31_06130 [Pontibacillus sp. ALD_SL1]